MKFKTVRYRYACTSCGEVNEAEFFKRFRFSGPGFKTWVEKCVTCSLPLSDGECAYTRHVILNRVFPACKRSHSLHPSFFLSGGRVKYDFWSFVCV